MAEDEAAAPDIEPDLHADDPAIDAGVGESLVAVVDLSTEDAGLGGVAPDAKGTEGRIQSNKDNGVPLPSAPVYANKDLANLAPSKPTVLGGAHLYLI
jgi:hypothetical protein